MSHFLNSVFLTFRGALIGQLVPVLAMPIISRLYGPDTYGIFASLLSLSVVLTVLMMAQMEVAVVLPEDDAEAGRVARTAAQLGIIIASVLTILVLSLQPGLQHLEGFMHLYGWSVLTPAIGLLMAFALLGNYIASRRQMYAEIGASAAMLQIANCAATVLLGLIQPGVMGLILGRTIGQVGAVFAYARSMRWLADAFRRDGILSFRDMRAVLAKYHKFPLYSLPHTLLSMLSRECVPVILIFFHQPHAAGFYALVRSVLMMPVSLLSTAIGQIFYREASRGADKPQFQSFSYTLMIAVACIVTPGSVYVAGWGPEIFAFVFGDEWKNAGIYAMLFMPVSLLFILSIWVGRIFEVRNKQDLLFRIQLFFDTLSIGTLILTLISGWSPVTSVGAYIMCQVFYLLVFLGFVFRLLNLSAARYAVLLGVVCAAAAGQLLIHFFITATGAATWLQFAVETGLITLVTLGTGMFFWHRFRHEPALNLASGHN